MSSDTPNNDQVFAEIAVQVVGTLGDVQSERKRQTLKWGHQDYLDDKWFKVLMEEIGEVAKELVAEPNTSIQSERREYLLRLRTEVIQSAAVCCAWAEKLQRRIDVMS